MQRILTVTGLEGGRGGFDYGEHKGCMWRVYLRCVTRVCFNAGDS